MFGTLADSGLAKARMKIGRALHWDDRDLTRPMGLVGDRVSLAVYVKHTSWDATLARSRARACAQAKAAPR